MVAANRISSSWAGGCALRGLTTVEKLSLKKKVAVLKDKSKKVQFADVCWVEEEESVRCEAKGQRRLQ